MAKRRKKEWFDDDAFWKETYPFMFPKTRIEEGNEQLERILALANPTGKAVLDLCCGPGRITVPLAQAGYQATGVDRTTYLLQKAKARARRAKVTVEWVQMDMRDFVRPAAFDLVLSMFTSFGYFDNKEEDMLVLGNVAASLKPGGVFVIDVMGKERLAAIMQPTTSQELQDGTLLVQRHEVFDGWSRIRNEWILIRKGRAKRYSFHHTLYSGQELRDRLELAGFDDIQVCGNLAGDSYGPGAARLIAVARKE